VLLGGGVWSVGGVGGLVHVVAEELDGGLDKSMEELLDEVVDAAQELADTAKDEAPLFALGVAGPLFCFIFNEIMAIS